MYRYIRGKLLIVMKSGPYNRINGIYDGRHGLTSNLDFRNYIEKLIALYSVIYRKVIHNAQTKNISDDETERIILNLNEFNKNPFKDDIKNHYNMDEMNQKYIEEKKSKEYVISNYNSWCFSSILDHEKISSPKTKFYFDFRVPYNGFSFDFLEEPIICISNDGYIKEFKSPLDTDCYYTCDREKAIDLRNKFQKK